MRAEKMDSLQKAVSYGALKANPAQLVPNLKVDFKLHPLTQTQAEIKQTSNTIMRNRSAARIIERQPSGKAPFFKAVEAQTRHWMGEDTLSSKAGGKLGPIGSKPSGKVKEHAQKGFRLGSAALSGTDTKYAENSQTVAETKVMNPSLASHLKRHMGGTTISHKAFKRTMSANYLVRPVSNAQTLHLGFGGSIQGIAHADEDLKDIDDDASADLGRETNRPGAQGISLSATKVTRSVRPGTAIVSWQQRPLTGLSTTLTIAEEKVPGPALVATTRPTTAKPGQLSGSLGLSGPNAPAPAETGALAEDSREEDSSADQIGPPIARRSINQENQSLEAAINLSLPQTDARSEIFGTNLIRDLDPIHELKARYDKNPKAVVEENFVRMKNLAAMLNLTQTEREKTREEMLEQERKKTDPRMFKGRYADFEPVMPWEKVSIYRDGEPEYNDPLTSFDYQPEPVIDIKPEKEEEIRKLMEGLYEKFDFYKKYTNIEYDEECKYLKVEPTKLALYEIHRIRRQYDNKSQDKPFDIAVVEEIVKPLPFFMKFDSDVRKQILSKAELVEYPAGHTVFKQGDFGDKMYIILQGSVNVMIHYSDPITAKPMSRVVAWMRDGSSFGEYSMLGSKSRTIKDTVFTSMSKLSSEINNRLIYLKRAIIYQEPIDLKEKSAVDVWKKNRAEEFKRQNDPLYQKNTAGQKEAAYQERTKRAADIVATENLFMLELSREYFREIILTTIKDEYERKMRLLSELPLFKVSSL